MTPIDLSGMPHGHLQQEAQRALWKVLLRQAQSGLLSRPSLQLAYNLPMALPDFSGDNAYTLSWNSLVFASMAISEFMVKTEDIHPPKTGISVHFCVLSLMAMQK